MAILFVKICLIPLAGYGFDPIVGGMSTATKRTVLIPAPAPAAAPVPSGVPTLTLNREGDFRLRVYGDAHCGKADHLGMVPCYYKLTLCCDAKGLDSDGFLVEQFGIDRFFKDLPATPLSCELLVIDCARQIYRKVMKENANATIFGLALEISPRPEGAPGAAGMTFRWGNIH